ncbi:MAG: putative substrate-binding component of transporter [Ramlibacter sp.]|nr:putative substrate-binding component of transporter [Ramlibacter sp.]
MRRITLAAFAATALLLVALNARADDKTILMVSGVDKQIYLPAILAQRLGYFRDQGLQVELQSEPSGVSAADVLLAGAAHGVIGAYDHAVDLQAKGKSVQSVVQFTIAPGEVELVGAKLAARIASPADFRGRNLGVTGLGSSTSFLTQYLAVLHGVKPAELTLVPVGSGETFIAAMEQGRIDAGMTTEPTASRLVAAGTARVLVDLRTPEATQKALGGLYPFACLYMQTAWINGHRSDVQKLANALVRSLRYINTHSAAEIAAQLPPAYFAGNRPLYVQSLAASKSMFTPDGAMPAEGPATVLKVLSAVSKVVRGKTIDLSKTYTTEFVSAAPGN